ncbi:PepSY domain-containing protein [Paenibacillus sp. IB182496]|uniref:PepSY domain-containing protein n=1 Tax=Paenibacillus sabuli TaxID=2772509 RepID=A0A927BVN5_9BACL|nr:PepSY domain-containing protein [Paenibacillus sabuli]MBD2847691.1 PepSY domain-containing protein [Paenibacillus sabuli]
MIEPSVPAQAPASASAQEAKPSAKPRLSTALYQSVWRWHFYAGLLFAPFLIILALSGGLYLFKPQIEGMLYKDMLTVQDTGAARLTPEALIAKTERAYPGTSISSMTFSDHPNETVKMSATRNGQALTLYADPYNGQLTGTLVNDSTFAAVVKKIHSQLLVGGTWANRLVELAACWAIILVATGLYLWWPRGKSSIWGTLLPRRSRVGSRQFWRDLHAVPAFWLSLLILVLIASGLPWSGVLGAQIDRLANSTHSNYPPYALSFLPGPESTTILTQDIADDIPWATQNLPVPASMPGNYVRQEMNAIVQVADAQNVRKPYTISLPRGEQGVYTIATSHTRPGHNATLHVDQYSGAVLTDVRFAQYGLMAKAITLGIAFHEGRLFGLANQLLGLLVCIGIVLIAVSSFFMWRKRKPQGKSGAPAAAKLKTARFGVLAILLVCGAVMPLVGLSILAVLLAELLVLRRIKPIKRWLSL